MSFFTVISPEKVGKENTTHSLTAKKPEDVTFITENGIVLDQEITAEKGIYFYYLNIENHHFQGKLLKK